MFILSLVVASLISCPSFGSELPSYYIAKKTKKKTKATKTVIPIETEAVQFLTRINTAFRENGLNVFSKQKIQNLPKTVLKDRYDYEDEPLNKKFLLLRDSFISFMEKMFIKNPNIVPEQYRVALPDLPLVQQFLIQLAPQLAQKAQGDIDDDEEIDFVGVSVDLEMVVEKLASAETVLSTYQSLFPEEPIDFTEVCALCQRHDLDTPTHPTDPAEFVYRTAKLNTNKDEMRRIRRLSTNHSLFTKWMVISLKEALSDDASDKEEVRRCLLFTLFSLLYDSQRLK